MEKPGNNSTIRNVNISYKFSIFITCLYGPMNMVCKSFKFSTDNLIQCRFIKFIRQLGNTIKYYYSFLYCCTFA